jgi:hypothetical protein
MKVHFIKHLKFGADVWTFVKWTTAAINNKGCPFKVMQDVVLIFSDSLFPGQDQDQ